ncbi:MAG: hypothetical protein ACT4NY_00085 [Pseudonocardiales bacterium]
MSDYLKCDPLTDEELDTFVALRRVGGPGGGVAELDGRYYHHGRPIVPWLENPLTALVEAKLIMLSDPDPESGGLRRATLTAAGEARYKAHRRQLAAHHSRQANTCLPPGGETVTSWYMASLADGQTHLADRAGVRRSDR